MSFLGKWWTVLAALTGAVLWAAPAFAQATYPLPGPAGTFIAAPAFVNMCPTAQGTVVPCGSAGALPFATTIVGTPPVVPQQPQVITAIGTGTTGAVTATLPITPGKTAYICSFDVSAIGGTAAVGPITITGLLNGTFTYQFSSLAAGATFSKVFTPCVPASSISQAIAVVTTADGTASAVDVNVVGVAQ